MLYKVGSTGNIVRQIQSTVGTIVDGFFGPATKRAVMRWQKNNNLVADGIVGTKTLTAMDLLDNDLSISSNRPPNPNSCFKEGVFQFHPIKLKIEKFYISEDEYLEGQDKPEYIFLHHTSGWHNPFKTVRGWDNDQRGRIGTEFVIGGQSIKGDDLEQDGIVVQAFPPGCWAYHLGRNGSSYMHKNSVGIELCNFGYIKTGKTWAGTTAHPSQIVELKKPFRGYRFWQKYSDKQLEELKKLLIFIGDRDNIDIREGLPSLIRQHGIQAFDFNKDAFNGEIRGILSHTNTRKDKTDVFPQQELIDMLLSL